jgi:hypothetical protein
MAQGRRDNSQAALVEPEDLQDEDQDYDDEGREMEEQSLYQLVCDLLRIEKEPDEENDDFKIRVIRRFSNMDEWPDEQYERLPEPLQDWIYNTIQTYKKNRAPERKRKSALPALPGLDGDLRRRWKREDIDAPLKTRGRSRSGEDCLTRTMEYVHSNPDNSDTRAIVEALEQQHGKKYSYSAVRFAQNAYHTAKRIMQGGDSEHQSAE